MKEKIRCILVDDENNVRKRTEDQLKKILDLDILASLEMPEEALECIVEQQPDIVFVDVEMPKMNGFELMDAVRAQEINPTFIFVTGFNHYAINALKKEAFDYLVKPVSLVELSETLSRYKSKNKSISNWKTLPFLLSLSPSELKVLEMAKNGSTREQTARELFIEKTTVDSHRKSILEKTSEKNINSLLVRIVSSLK